MSVALASTWHPRGEIHRFQAIYQQLEQVYDGITIAIPQDVSSIDMERVSALAAGQKFSVVASPKVAYSRYVALQSALETAADFVHYVDMDRLLHWVETRPSEWRQTAAAAQSVDCLIIGRSEHAFRTHPQALQQTENIINAVFSYLLKRSVDLGGGSRGFSRPAVKFLMANSTPGSWVDAEWPMLLHQAGFSLDYLAVDGLDWESADRYRLEAADAETQRRLADTYDTVGRNWDIRVRIALDIVRAGLDAGPK